jgi:hypothetical protein
MPDHQFFRSVTRLTRLVSFALLLALSGCIQMHTTVHVGKDGRGTIEQKMLFAGMLSGMMNNNEKSDPSGKEEMQPKDEQLRKQAAEFGDEVRFKDIRMVENREGRGYVATFAFDDIEKVRIGSAQKMSTNLSADSTSVKVDSTKTEKPETWFTFTMKRGVHPELVISKHSELHTASSTQSVQNSPVKGGEKEQKEMLDMMTPFLKGMKMVIDVVVDGRIVRSDASFRTGNRIVLYAMDFDRLLARRDILTGKYNGLSDREFVRRSGKNSGLQFEFRDQVHVLFN